MSDLNRRDFIRAGAMAGIGVSLASMASSRASV
ncbi:MAG: twin-arginine translocation signal domain-containing protein, partial [Planctomycetota bacterium]